MTYAKTVSSATSGKVWLVGTGPGDPELLTMKAYKVIQEADLILYDNLVSEEIRALFPRGVPALYVGKCKDQHSIRQEDLNALLVKRAYQSKSIARVKGGDPFVFGRGSEEMLRLKAAGVDVEVVPGVTSASGCGTYAGIPLTHRGMATGVTLVTAHTKDDTPPDWDALARLNHTLVFYMGISKAQDILDGLVGSGSNVNTPVAIIENGCRPNQRNIITTLSELSKTAAEAKVKSPALIIVGEVVSLAEVLGAEAFAPIVESAVASA